MFQEKKRFSKYNLFINFLSEKPINTSFNTFNYEEKINKDKRRKISRKLFSS